MNYVKLVIGMLVVSVVVGGMSMEALAFLGLGDSVRWKEEVLLHDGRKIIVERSQSYGGYSEPAAKDPKLIEEKWKFNTPDTKQHVVWANDYGNKPENKNLMLIMLDFKDGVPYMATRPAGCISFNNWKRPNPPYVFLKYEDAIWQQIPLSEFPSEFRDANVVVGRPDPDNRSGTLSITKIRVENALLEPYMKRIIREPLSINQAALIGCEELIYYKGEWIFPNDPIAHKMLDLREKRTNK